MSALFLISLLILAASPAIMRSRYGHEWKMRPYGVFVIVAVIYHGVSEILIRWTHADVLAAYRVEQQFVDDGMFVAALSLLVMTIGYVVVAPRREIARDIDYDTLWRAFDWRVFGILVIPLFISTVHGKGYANGTALNGQGITDQGLASQFFVPIVAMTTFAFLLRHPRRWIPAILVQSVIMAAAGQRLEVLIAAVSVMILAGRIGMKPSWQQVAVVASVAILGLLAISASRAEQGRTVFQSNSGFGTRFSALIQGIEHPTVQSVHGGTPLAELGLRLDSNSFAGGVMKAFEAGNHDPLGWEGPKSSLITAIPSFMDANKIEQLRPLDFTPKNEARDELGVYNSDYLEGSLTTFLGNFGPAFNIAFDLLCGLVLGLLDNAVLRRATIWRLVGYLLLVQSALFFERGIDNYVLTLRAFIGFVVVAWVLAAVSRAIDPGQRLPTTRMLTPRGSVAGY